MLRADETTAVLVDTGPEPGPTLACLESLGIERVPLLVLTHFHADHIGGTEAVLSRFHPELVLVSPLRSPGFAAASVGAAHEGGERGLGHGLGLAAGRGVRRRGK